MADALLTAIRLRDTHRLTPSRYPSVGIFDAIAAPEDLEAIIELAGWTDDRISAELGVIRAIPAEEWAMGPMASVVMAAFCHPDPRGVRFNDARLGAWYAGKALEKTPASRRFIILTVTRPPKLLLRDCAPPGRTACSTAAYAIPAASAWPAFGRAS